jgi:hypothetical protein
VTHADLVVIAERWLRNAKGCRVVLTERASACSQVPDAIGWHGRQSHLVEVKSSRSDFLRDKDKCSRRVPEYAMGSFRWFLAPVGIIAPLDLPEHWGLVEVAEGVARARHAAERQPRSETYEIGLLLSELSIIQRAQRGHSVIDTARARETLRGFSGARFVDARGLPVGDGATTPGPR